MSAYMVAPVQQAVLASLILRMNRDDILNWIESKPQVALEFETEAMSLVHALTRQSTDSDIINALIHLFSASNFQSILSRYSLETALDMTCSEKTTEALTAQAGDNSKLLGELALANYIKAAKIELERQAVDAVIDTTSEPQYLMWFANLRYQTCEYDDFEKSNFSILFNYLAPCLDIDRPEFNDCEWSLDSV